MVEISIFELFRIFFLVGLFTIGGGQVAITLMQESIVERALISSEDFFNMVAVSESTPGPIGVNMATYLGYRFYGVGGALVTTFAEILPSIICILLIAKFFTKFKQTSIVQSVFSFIRPCATSLVLVAALNVIKISLINPGYESFSDFFYISSLVFYAGLTLIEIKFKLHPIILVMSGAVFGLLCL